MSVLAPIFLLGALFAAVPVIIHLFYQKRAPQVYFSTIRFLQACVRKTARRKRVENLLLLAFRMLLFGLLAVALARPFLRSSLAGSSGPTSTVIVLDNSYSMATRQEGKERFAQAKQAVIDLVQRMSPNDSVALIFTGGPRAADKVELSHRFNEVIPSVEQAQIFAGYGNVLAAVNRACEVMQSSTDANREVVVITDLQAKSLEGDLSAATLAAREVPLFFLDCGQEAVVNLGVVDASLRGGRMPGSLQTLVAEVVNTGERNVADARVTLYVDGKDVKKELVSVPAKGKATVPFTFPVATDRTATGWVQLSEDSLEADNRWNFRIAAADRIHVLVARDESAEIGYLDDGYYLVRALAPSSDDNVGSSPIRPQLRLTSEISRLPLEPFSAIFLLNVRELDAAAVTKLRRWVEEGGMLVFFAGDRVDPLRWTFFGPGSGALFPAKVGAAVGDAEKRDTSRHLQSPDFSWPGFARLRGVPPSLFERVRAWKWLPLENADAEKVHALANLVIEGQSPVPMISSARLERGEVFYVSVPATTGWTNFPATKVFVPMLHEMVYAVTGKSGRLESTTAGQPRRFDFADVNGEVMVSVEARPGVVEVKRSTHDAAGNFAQFDDTWLPGIYPYTLSGAKQGKDFFVVNPDPRESDLARTPEDAFRAKFAASRLVLVRSSEQLETERIALREGHPLTGYVFLLIIVIAAFELYLANRTRPVAEPPAGSPEAGT